MEDKFKFVVRGRKDGNKFILEEITNYILKNLESFDEKTIIVTFELPVTTNEIKIDNSILINWWTIMSLTYYYSNITMHYIYYSHEIYKK